MPHHRIRLTNSPRPCWFVEWLDQDDSIPGVNYREGMATLFRTKAAAQSVAAQLPWYWLPVVEEEG
jgi:hypothetical protein